MAVLHPFKALRPVPEKAHEVACVPYDVINSEEARLLAEDKPLSFLHVIRPEIDLPEATDEHAKEVYERGAENLRSYRHSPYAIVEDQPGVYVYRLIMNGRAQTGIFACVSTMDYDENIILKHELTRPVKEDDRTRHILEQQAHAEPVMLTFRDDPAVRQYMDSAIGTTPLYDILADDGIRHTIWKSSMPRELVDAFADIPRLYVADGHHRCKAASRAAEQLSGPIHSESRYFPAVLFPMSDMAIMAYNRIIKNLPSKPDAFLAQLKEQFDVHPHVHPVPEKKGDICLLLDNVWYGMTLPNGQSTDPVSILDVERLSRSILEPMLGIADQRRDANIDFVGGIRGTAELERLVRSGVAQMAISMYPTSIDELVSVSDAGLLMPPKSTWFEPKLRSGLLVHLIN